MCLCLTQPEYSMASSHQPPNTARSTARFGSVQSLVNIRWDLEPLSPSYTLTIFDQGQRTDAGQMGKIDYSLRSLRWLPWH
jgi:hypothetical protein